MAPTRHFVQRIALAAVAAVALAGCANGRPAPTTTTTTTSSTNTSTNTSNSANAVASTTTTSAATTLPAAIQHGQECLNALGAYLTLSKVIGQMSPGAPLSVFSAIINDADNLRTALVIIAPLANTAQRPVLAQYEGAVAQLATAASDASAGDLQAADEKLAGLAPQLGAIPAFVNSVCGSG
ncbi:MAG: hypothetical protein ACYCQK_01795 [Acidiferrobacteraceae bacterium]